MKQLQAIGVGKLFAPGANMQEIVTYINEWVKHNR
jgi:hypothetical protein